MKSWIWECNGKMHDFENKTDLSRQENIGVVDVMTVNSDNGTKETHKYRRIVAVPPLTTMNRM